MPGLVVGEGRRPTRDNCRILRPYILWKRRKEQLAERALFMKVKHEEEQRKREEEERKCAEREKKLSRIEEIEEELLKVRQKKYNLEENLKLLQEQKHQLFLCLKTTLLAKEHVRQERAPTITHEISVQHHETGGEFTSSHWNMPPQQHQAAFHPQPECTKPEMQDSHHSLPFTEKP